VATKRRSKGLKIYCQSSNSKERREKEMERRPALTRRSDVTKAANSRGIIGGANTIRRVQRGAQGEREVGEKGVGGVSCVR